MVRRLLLYYPWLAQRPKGQRALVARDRTCLVGRTGRGNNNVERDGNLVVDLDSMRPGLGLLAGGP